MTGQGSAPAEPPRDLPRTPTAAHGPDLSKVLTEEWIEEVARTTDADLRAHAISLTYYVLGRELDDLIYGTHSVSECLSRRESPSAPAYLDEPARICNANWFQFAMWGTLTVTQNIGTSRPPQRLNVGALSAVRRYLTPAAVHARAADGQIVGRALAWGQLLIFVSVCYAMYNFRTSRGTNFALTDEQRDKVRELSRWDGVSWIDEDDHVASIEDAFELFALAKVAAERHQSNGHDPRPKGPQRAQTGLERSAQLVLGANIMLTAVEQYLVDPAISIVLNLVPSALRSMAVERSALWAERYRGIPQQLSALALPHRIARQVEVLERAWSRFMTDSVLVMALPTETLRLGRDIPPRRLGLPMYPRALQQLGPRGGGANGARTEEDHALQEVADLVDSLDRTAGGGRGSAAKDWRRWDERMSWAVVLMRSRQMDPTLFWAPYSDADMGRIVAHELPKRTGDPSALQVSAPMDGSVFWGVSDRDFV